MIAVVPVREGALPAGGAEVVAEARGRAILVGGGARAAAAELGALAAQLELWDTPGFEPGAWSVALGPRLAEERMVLLPASPDGRDLAPRLATELGHELLTGAVQLRGAQVRTVGYGGAAMIEHHLAGSAVVTLQPGVRGIDPHADHHPGPPDVTDLTAGSARGDDGAAAASRRGGAAGRDAAVRDPRTIEILPPDASTMDLAEAPRILAGGNGIAQEAGFVRLAAVAAALDASVGTTRVITDKGWLPHERQIGTTGVVVDPDLYVAFGISGAVQHTSGLGQPDHVISVNTDPHCPMMSLADLAVVADADATLEALEDLLTPSAGRGGDG